MDEDMKMETLMKLATEVFGIPDPRTADGAPSEDSGEAEDNVAVEEGDDGARPAPAPSDEGEIVPDGAAEPQPVDTPQSRQRIKIKGKADGARPAPAPVVAKKGARLAKKQESDPLATKQETKSRYRALPEEKKERTRLRARIRYYTKKGLTESEARDIIAQRDAVRGPVVAGGGAAPQKTKPKAAQKDEPEADASETASQAAPVAPPKEPVAKPAEAKPAVTAAAPRPAQAPAPQKYYSPYLRRALGQQ